MSFKLDIDAKGIASQFGAMAKDIENEIKASAKELAAMTHAQAVDMAENKLKNSSVIKKYTENLGWEEISNGLYVVYVNEDALWIEEGIPANTDMKTDEWLLKNAKTAKNGTKYKVIPFHYERGGVQKSNFTNKMIGEIRRKFAQENKARTAAGMEKITFRNIEKHSDGTAKVGKLHEFDFGGPYPGPNASTRALKRLSIYQHVKDGKARRDILTFRTVSNGPGSQGKWMHPGRPPLKILDAAFEWAAQKWEQEMLPKILDKVK